jgi:hypothetical protein
LREFKDFARIAQCGLVLDVDLSRWGARLRLVVAEGSDFQWSDSSPIFNIDFNAPTLFNFSSPHWDDLDGLRWELWSSTVQEVSEEAMDVSLSGLGPTAQIRCTGIQVSWVSDPSPWIIDKQWHAPGHGLLRPPLEEVISRLRRVSKTSK